MPLTSLWAVMNWLELSFEINLAEGGRYRSPLQFLRAGYKGRVGPVGILKEGGE